MNEHAGICFATGKRIYKRHQDAAKVCGRARKQSADGQCSKAPISQYRCESCKKWHVSSMSQLEHEVRKLVREAA